MARDMKEDYLPISSGWMSSNQFSHVLHIYNYHEYEVTPNQIQQIRQNFTTYLITPPPPPPPLSCTSSSISMTKSILLKV